MSDIKASNILWALCRCSTIGAIIMTPLLTKLLAGQLVPVDAVVSSNMMDN